MTKIQRKARINARHNEISAIRNRLPTWGSYAKDIVNHLGTNGIHVTQNQVYIAVKTGLGSKADHILVAMKTLASAYEKKLEEIAILD